MPELPEVASRAREMNAALPGKTISAVEVLQPKCLNVPVEEFARGLTGATIQDVHYRGKWILNRTDQGWLLLNLGMGGEILLTNRQNLPEKYRLIFDFTDGTCLAVNFWWFGYAHFAATDALDRHVPTAKLGQNALEVTPDDLARLFQGQRGKVKMLLLDQSRISGIGNAYIHDILFMARIHPLRPANSLTAGEISALVDGIQKGLRPSLEQGGAFYEKTLDGKNGGFTVDQILIGYRENQPCPVCGTPIQKIKTGGTSTFICPTCQVV
jgi:formamidopyrimidine-DNA glycosylase